MAESSSADEGGGWGRKRGARGPAMLMASQTMAGDGCVRRRVVSGEASRRQQRTRYTATTSEQEASLVVARAATRVWW